MKVGLCITEREQVNAVMEQINSDTKSQVFVKWMADAATLVKEDTGIDSIILVNHGYPEQDPVVIVRFDGIEVFVSISDKPETIDNPQVDVSLSEVINWVKLNKKLLLEYWNDDLYPTSKMLSEIKKLDHNLS